MVVHAMLLEDYIVKNGQWAAACFILSAVDCAAAAPLNSLYVFKGGTDGSAPSGLVADAAGNLYGTTFNGGTNSACNGCGTVFELSPPAGGQGVWTYTLLYSFAGFGDGNNPAAALAIDASGNLYGTTQYGGGPPYTVCAYGCGTIFRLQPPTSAGGMWTESVLYRFTGGADGGTPFTPVTIGASGKLYGTTYYYGATAASACMQANQPNGCGVVYQLSPPAAGSANWTETVLHSFTNAPDGAYPAAGLIVDPFGNLFGTTAYGGSTGFGYGTVFMLRSPAPGSTAWTESVLWKFNYADGYFPFDPLIFGPGGLYGTTRAGGDACAITGTGTGTGCGLVFALLQPAQGKTNWTEQVLHKFRGGKDGAYPSAGLTFDSSGYLLGTTTFGGGGPCSVPGYDTGCGTVYQLAPPVSGTAWTETILYAFQDLADGAFPGAGLIYDLFGDYAGTTATQSSATGMARRSSPATSATQGTAFSVRRG
jgi:uncharacterized repeat protein (TIGR03803 family)